MAENKITLLRLQLLQMSSHQMLHESVLNVPADSGIYFLFASKPAMATGPMIGRNLASNITMPPVTFQQILLSPQAFKTAAVIGICMKYIDTAFLKSHDNLDCLTRLKVLLPNLHLHDEQKYKQQEQFLL